MINKPKDYDNIPIGVGESLKAGGHKCVIKKLEEATSSKGNQMLVIYFDTADEDIQPGFYMNRYVNDTRADKKWGGRFFLVNGGEYGPANLRRFVTSVADSNDENVLMSKGWKEVKNGRGQLEWQPSWGSGFEESFKDMKVGLVFRKEEYTREDHTLGVATKGFRWCNYDKAYEQKEPERKAAPAPIQQPDYGFVNVPADALEDEGLPFK